MNHDPYRPPTPARPRPAAPPPPPSAALHVALPGGVHCRSWDDFFAVSAQRWNELRDHLTSGRLGAALARAGHAERVPDPNARESPDERLDDWLGALPTTRTAVPELDVQPSRIDLQASGEVEQVRLRIANVGYRLLRFRVEIEPADATWLILPASADGGELVTVEGTTLDLTVIPPRRLRRPLTATVRITSNGGERLVPVSIRPATAVVQARPAWNLSGCGMGAAIGFVSRPLVLLLDRLLPNGTAFASTGLVLGVLGLGVGAWLVGRKAGLVDRVFGALAGLLGGLLAADVALMAVEAMPTAPWWLASLAWSALGALAAFATGLHAPRTEGASR